MANSSPYTVKTLLLYLADLERRRKTVQQLPDADGLDADEDPRLLMSARLGASLGKLREWPDVQRMLRDCEAARFTFDAAGMNQWVALVCKAHKKLPDEVANWNLDAFCDLADRSGGISGTVADVGKTAYRHGDTLTATNRKRPGRKKADYETVQREAQLATDWERARYIGTYKADFAKGKGLNVKDLDSLLARVRMRNSGAKE